ncbi:MAG: hypothetical protein NWQ54_15550 [Paraglaciecola sp.]|uniref:hypothetical protein n=1 Tax=Paraglaciecola sp. TaxID=1920173 RepID=UPI00273FCB18|nr:hypothetical protein [Paraglaciecola sp.]MDP5030750.1 hypothetical protein [Paraglaciecola sp.]MDP5132300.1 hypothetical protein [Paraglaciecola sp.]
MDNIICCIDVDSNSLHLQQFYLGLVELVKQDKITLNYRFTSSCKNVNVPSSVQKSIAKLNVNDCVVVFDMADSALIQQEYLDSCDFYFKRSFSIKHISQYRGAEKVKPYGLNYLVFPDNVVLFNVMRACNFIRSGEWIKQIIRSLDIYNKLQYSPRLADIQDQPKPDLEPNVLFLARSWDESSDEHLELTIEEKIDRVSINEVRAECVRQLRKEFGSRFTGGLIPTPHAKKYYADCLVSNATLTLKRNYINLVKQHSICVSTTGLHGSIGWKFGEFIALSKAIVSEPLCYEVPGSLKHGENLLVFEHPDKCVEQVGMLMDSADLRRKLMINNHNYYKNFLKPDVLVLNALKQVL